MWGPFFSADDNTLVRLADDEPAGNVVKENLACCYAADVAWSLDVPDEVRCLNLDADTVHGGASCGLK